MTTFVILNWNRAALTITAVENLLLREPGLYGVIIVDNGSREDERDKLVEYAKKNGWVVIGEEIIRENDKVNLIENGQHSRILLLANENYGYAKGNNLGLKLAKKLGYEWAVVMNNDIIIETPVFEKLLCVVNKNKDQRIAVIGPKIVAKLGSQGPFEDYNLYLLFFLPILFPLLWPVELIRFVRRKYVISKHGVYYPYWISGCYMLLNLNAMEEVGWFDEKTFLYAEELILSSKLFRKGYKVAYTDKVYVKHLHEASTSTLFNHRKRLKIMKEANLYYLKEYKKYGPIKLFLANIGMSYLNGLVAITFPILLPVAVKFREVISHAQRYYFGRRIRNKALSNDSGNE
ncbi:glycosyltransferase family 2 protein [Fervidobacterium riparium]|nr:hypothetical protein IB67_09915 [Fervidobacterium riparium]